MKLPYAQVDAFADRPFTGNPAAVMVLDRWLDDALLADIAAEHNLSETAFLVRADDGEADYDLRWFTPAAEVALCGHATLASGHHLLERDAALERVTFRTRKAGVLTVSCDGDGYRLALPNWKPSPTPLPEFVAALRVEAIDTLWHERGYPLVIVADETAVRACAPDLQALARHPVVAIVSARGETADVVSRVFTPFYDINEDPVTGAAHAVMVPYWAEKLGRDRFTAYQASKRGGYLDCQLAGDRVVLGGRCVTVAEGLLTLAE